MSLISGIRGFSVSMYGQSGIVMDWFGLNDPFTQQVPLKITNAYSGTLWFQGYLSSPRSGYYNYSGIQMGDVNSGASETLVMTWDAGVSGWITTSSPITDTLTLNITTYTSSNYTGSYSSGNFTVFNTLFNRYSGLIRVFGDIYDNDVPVPSLALGLGVGFVSGQLMSYAISYIKSGWESDISAPANITTGTTSGANQISVSWTAITGVTQYFVWRWSGSADNTSMTTTPAAAVGRISGMMDLQAVTTTNSYTDIDAAAARAALYRHRTWQYATGAANAIAIQDSTISLSAPSSRRVSGTSQVWAHSYYLQRNASGTSLLGPFYGVFHARPAAANVYAIHIQTGENAQTSGTAVADRAALSGILSSVWYRHVTMLGSSGSLSASGKVAIQVINQSDDPVNLDDVFICAQS